MHYIRNSFKAIVLPMNMEIDLYFISSQTSLRGGTFWFMLKLDSSSTALVSMYMMASRLLIIDTIRCLGST